MTRAEAVRVLVENLDAEGLDPEEIAARVGVPVTRVSRVLDAIDGVPRPSLLLDLDQPEPKPRGNAGKPRTPKGQGGKCGTYGGNWAHSKRGEKPCFDCAEVRRVYQREKAAEKRAARLVTA